MPLGRLAMITHLHSHAAPLKHTGMPKSNPAAAPRSAPGLRSGGRAGAAGSTQPNAGEKPGERAERFIEVRGDDPEVAAKLRIEERELEMGGRN